MTKQKNWLTLLRDGGIENPAQELRYITRYAEIHGEERDRIIDAIVERRSKREPLAKIIGYKEFWKDRFITNEHTLDPRPDSESLIETCLSLSFIDSHRERSDLSSLSRPTECSNLSSSSRPTERSEGAERSRENAGLDPSISPTASLGMTILELGVGTGCLLLSLLKEWPHARGVGVDISQEALKIASQNVERLGLTDRVELIQSDWFSHVPQQQFDLIISNPPYISVDEEINKEAQHDPHIALYADDQGLAAYKKILERASEFLKPQGYLIFEIGPSWQYYTHNIKSDLKLLNVVKDLSGLDRVVVFQKSVIAL